MSKIIALVTLKKIKIITKKIYNSILIAEETLKVQIVYQNEKNSVY